MIMSKDIQVFVSFFLLPYLDFKSEISFYNFLVFNYFYELNFYMESLKKNKIIFN